MRISGAGGDRLALAAWMIALSAGPGSLGRRLTSQSIGNISGKPHIRCAMLGEARFPNPAYSVPFACRKKGAVDEGEMGFGGMLCLPVPVCSSLEITRRGLFTVRRGMK